MNKVNNRTILIAGPTGSGKSNLAIKIAQKCKGIIINADSMQIYKQLSIVTARPSIEDEANTPHFLYGNVDANKRYSAGDWLESAKDIITFTEKLDLVTVIVGGTGLYFDSLFGSLSNIPGISDKIRKKWLGIKNDMGSSYLYQQLLQLDPAVAASLNPNDSNRIIRALEVFEETGISIQEWRRSSGDKVISSHNSVRIFLNPDKDCLHLNIWTPPASKGNGPFPIFFWIHGGGWLTGSGSEPMYDGKRLASEGDGTIVVSINYRLGA
ncbi:MAG: tRNA (adenosine(37)-N6)-dimethylallyltransferase MiaA, partial [Rhodobiaceae bacterium]|nr:tRNA (adenosine(37)-N6)-dimethylallyltransferase MiaA [Rhodobiaceae bacterium]